MPTTGAQTARSLRRSQRGAAVRQMFDSIAPRYDLLNHVLSANVDRLWWRRAARRFRRSPGRSRCGGSGHLLRHGRYDHGAAEAPATGCAADSGGGFCARHAEPRSAESLAGAWGARREPYAVPLEADALHLPLRIRVAGSDCDGLRIQESGQLRGRPAGVSSRAEAGRAVGDSGLQRAGRPGGQGLCGLLPPRAAGHRAG